VGGTTAFTPRRFASCVAKEKSKSTIASIFPLFTAAVVVSVLAISGLVVGRHQARVSDERMKKLRGEV
jgi:hypothetical protein